MAAPHKLRTLILQRLKEQPQSGYGLAKRIHEDTGWRPSYGSIYPVLERLKDEGLIDYEEDGKRKLYSLTAEGKKEDPDTEALLARLKEDMKLIAHLCGFESEEHDKLLEGVLEAGKRGERPLKGIEPAVTRMKKAIWTLYEQGRLEKSKEQVNTIIDDATERLEQV